MASGDVPVMAAATGGLGASARKLLDDGEELYGLVTCRTRSRMPGVSGFYSGLIEIVPEDVELPKTMAVAVTSRRALVLAHSGPWSQRAEGVVVDMPLSEVDSVELDKTFDAWRVHWSCRGYRYTVTTTAGRAGPFARTLEAAVAAAPGA
jgi:hypothetical protein